MSAFVANFDGLVGQTHNYAGLSEGNLASARNKDQTAHPRAAALQGLAKMRALTAMGVPQGVLPPHERPFIPVLRALGLIGTDKQVWEHAWREEPALTRRAAAASAMWAANAATVSPSPDCDDGRVHISPANLHTMAHRALEAPATTRALRCVFPDVARFAVHHPLPAHAALADEGAANHMRLCAEPGAPGVEIFVYGETEGRFPARQALAASAALARRHGLDPARVVFARQSDEAIDAGAFHNDVVAVAHENVLLFHARAFADKNAVLDEIRRKAAGLFEPVFLEVAEEELPLAEAVASYLFNGQIVRAAGADRLTLILPEEARECPRAAATVERLTGANGPIGAARFFDLRQSMRNGGGPACLRLGVTLTDAERRAVTPGFWLSETLAGRLEAWIGRFYRESLAPADLADPDLVDENHAALEALTQILPLGSDFYDFQR
jgi:succinylarginine dihydrolase